MFTNLIADVQERRDELAKKLTDLQLDYVIERESRRWPSGFAAEMRMKYEKDFHDVKFD